jgi:hypothetical protein
VTFGNKDLINHTKAWSSLQLEKGQLRHVCFDLGINSASAGFGASLSSPSHAGQGFRELSAVNQPVLNVDEGCWDGIEAVLMDFP